MGLQELEACRVMQIIGIDVRVQRPRIDEDGYRAISDLRISSIRPEMSLAPLLPARAARSCLGVVILKYASKASRVTVAMGTPRISASRRRMLSRLSGSFTVVRFMVCQHTSRAASPVPIIRVRGSSPSAFAGRQRD